MPKNTSLKKSLSTTTTSLRPEDVEALHEIGAALAAHRDLETLLPLILEKSRDILSADAGSLFLAERTPTQKKASQLRFKLAQNDTVPVKLNEFVLPINSKSLVGYVADTRESIRLDDVYQIPANLPFSFKKEIDLETGYRSKSLISVPMLDYHGELIGVVQIWNKKKDRKRKLDLRKMEAEVIPFTDEDYTILKSVVSQAGMAIENVRLYRDIQNLFEGFVRASVMAIEARDPTTSGHSERVAELTLGLAKAVDRVDTGVLANERFNKEDLRQLEVAALLHDFGKIGVREAVLVKPKKLYPLELENLQWRFDYLYRMIELEIADKKLQHLANGGRVEDEVWQAYEREQKERLHELAQFNEAAVSSNEPTVLSEKVSNDLQAMAGIKLPRPNRPSEPLVTDDELFRLSIPKGSLSPEERLQIESHVTHSFQFLARIPWTRELRDVANIAYAHHEKLDGSGYPRGLLGPEIPLPSKIMTVADIFDALVARDRPYKKALPVQKALDILQLEVKDGKLDSTLVELFIQAQVFHLTTSSQ